MANTTSRTPAYRLHKPTRQAVVTLDGRDFYLGRHGSPQSRAEYDRMIAEWLSNGRRLPTPRTGKGSDATVNELAMAFLQWAEGYYRKEGEMTGEVVNIRYALRTLRQLYGHTPAGEFGPVALKTVRDALIGSGLCRNEVNRRCRIIVRMYRWAVEDELVPPSVHHGLKAVAGLRRGRADVRESEPVRPVPEAFVEAVRPYVSRQVWAMIQLQLLTGMRPGEVCSMRTCDLDTSGRLWTYTPASHKTEHHGRERRIYFGPQAQQTLRPWLRAELGDYLFSPAQAEAERRAERRSNRKTPIQPSQRNRRKRTRAKSPGAVYTVGAYRQAIAYGITRANRGVAERGEVEIPQWHPNQLRHNAATRLRREFGLDAARAVLGHSSPVVTEVYAERDAAVAMEAMAKVG